MRLKWPVLFALPLLVLANSASAQPRRDIRRLVIKSGPMTWSTAKAAAKVFSKQHVAIPIKNVSVPGASARFMTMVSRNKTVRPTPTAPKMKVQQLLDMGVRITAVRKPTRGKARARSARTGKIIKPTRFEYEFAAGKDFDAAKARAAGLIEVKGKTRRAHLRYLGAGL